MEGMTIIFTIMIVISTIGIIWTFITDYQDNLKKQTLHKKA